MEYVLVDIKNFLKKLENGQMEIEAGQWELHKTLESMSKTVTELSNLKEDVADMRRSNLHQMGLIKELQSKLDKISQTSQEDRPVTVSESSVEFNNAFKRPVDGQAFKKRKCIRAEEIMQIMSEVSNEKSETELDESVSTTQQRTAAADENEFKADENEKNSDGESIYKKKSYVIPAQNKPNSHYPVHTSNDILQRYLKDSARYYENKKSDSNDHCSKYRCEDSTCTETEIRPFWDEYGSRGKKEPHHKKECSNSKEKSMGADNSEENSFPKEFSCSNCSEKFESKIDLLRHKRSHLNPKGVLICSACGKGFSSKLRLKEHSTSHKFSRCFKGFKCCYCNKVCCTPRKLTEHVRKCRTIIRKFKK